MARFALILNAPEKADGYGSDASLKGGFEFAHG